MRYKSQSAYTVPAVSFLFLQLPYEKSLPVCHFCCQAISSACCFQISLLVCCMSDPDPPCFPEVEFAHGWSQEEQDIPPPMEDFTWTRAEQLNQDKWSQPAKETTWNVQRTVNNQIKWLTVTLWSYIPTKEILVHSLRLHGLQYTLTVI